MKEKIPLLMDRLDASLVRAVFPGIKFRETPEGYAADVSFSTLRTIAREIADGADPASPNDMRLAADLQELVAMHTPERKTNPAKKSGKKKARFKAGDIITAPWMTRTGKIFHVEWRDGWDNVPGTWAYHIGAWDADAGDFRTPRWYNESPDMKKAKAPKKPKPTRLQLMGARMARAGSRGTGAADREKNPASWHQKRGGMLAGVYAPHPTDWKVVGGRDMVGVITFKTEAEAQRYVENTAKQGERNVIIPPARAQNPDIHVDINSHNTGGRNVRAKNPVSKADHFDLARQQLYVWRAKEKEWLDTFRAAFRNAFGRDPSYGDTPTSGVGNSNLPEHDKEKLRAINAQINSAMDAAHRHYKMSGKRSWSKFKESETPAMKRTKNPRKKGGDSALWRYNRRTGYWTHERNVTDETAQAWLHIFMRDEPTEVFLLSATRPKDGLGALPPMARSKNPALSIESGPLKLKRGAGKHVLTSPVAAVLNVSGKADTFLLKLIGHTQGAGYWTGNGWDTTKSKGRVFASFDDAVAHGKRLANTIPATYRIEVHGA